MRTNSAVAFTLAVLLAGGALVAPATALNNIDGNKPITVAFVWSHTGPAVVDLSIQYFGIGGPGDAGSPTDSNDCLESDIINGNDDQHVGTGAVLQRFPGIVLKSTSSATEVLPQTTV
ncbi:MAG: hypothetical protein ACRDH5_05140, partial [bacterium]